MNTVLNKEGVEYGVYVSMTQTICPKCQIPFAVPTDLYQRRGADGEAFFCPNGHSQSFKESRVTKLERELKAAQVREQLAKDQRDSQAQLKEAAKEDARKKGIELKKTKTRLRNTREKIASGRCPCCGEHFESLDQHMKTSHPDEIKDIENDI